MVGGVSVRQSALVVDHADVEPQQMCWFELADLQFSECDDLFGTCAHGKWRSWCAPQLPSSSLEDLGRSIRDRKPVATGWPPGFFNPCDVIPRATLRSRRSGRHGDERSSTRRSPAGRLSYSGASTE